MGQCLKFCEGTFCLKMADSTAILVILFSILMLNQFSQRRKMRIESTVKKLTDKISFFKSYNCFKLENLQNLEFFNLKQLLLLKYRYFFEIFGIPSGVNFSVVQKYFDKFHDVIIYNIEVIQISGGTNRLLMVDNPYANNTFHLSKTMLNAYSIIIVILSHCANYVL